MNTDNGQIFCREEEAPVRLQDKTRDPRLSAASSQPATADIPALHSGMIRKHPDPERTYQKKPHSTKRQTVFAGSWIDRDTDSYIQNRQRQTRDSEGNKFTRSKIIALMLKERAQD